MLSADSFKMSAAISVDPDQTAPVGIHTVCMYAEISPWCKNLHAADDFSRRHFQMHFKIVGCKGLA